MRFSPRLHPYLVEKVWQLDDGRASVAELWRAVGREAHEIGLPAPCYHSVRVVVRRERERRAAQKEAVRVALAETMRWAPDGLRVLDHLAAAYELRRREP
jgi:hypothetical protein